MSLSDIADSQMDFTAMLLSVMAREFERTINMLEDHRALTEIDEERTWMKPDGTEFIWCGSGHPGEGCVQVWE